MLRQFFCRLLPRSLQIAWDYEGSKKEILRVLNESEIQINVPEIAEASSFGRNNFASLYRHMDRMVDEGLVQQIELPYHPVNDRLRGGRPRTVYEITSKGREEWVRLIGM